MHHVHAFLSICSSLVFLPNFEEAKQGLRRQQKTPLLGLLRKGRREAIFVVVEGGAVDLRGRLFGCFAGLGGEVRSVELEQVVSACDQSPFGLAGG